MTISCFLVYSYSVHQLIYSCFELSNVNLFEGNFDLSELWIESIHL